MSNRNLYLRAEGDRALTTEELRAKIPSIFATEKHFSCSERYVEIPSGDIIERLSKEGFYPVQAMQANPRDFSKFNKTKHVVRFRHQDANPQNRTVGGAFFEVIMRNSFDKTSGFHFDAGLFRWLCLNGMYVADSIVSTVHVHHSGNKDRLLTKVVEGVYTVVANAPKVIEGVKVWSNIQLSADERMELAGRAHILRWPDKDTSVTREQLLHPRRVGDESNDLWTVFNRVQENVIQGGLAAPRWSVRLGRNINLTTRAVRGIDQDASLNKALWASANDMAQYKLAA